jgi:Domain of unknown function (DUF6362)
MNKFISTRPTSGMLRSGIKYVSVQTYNDPQKLLNAEEIVARLEAAGATLIAMPQQGYTTHLRQMKFDIVHTALEAYGWQSAVARPPVRSAADVSLMDEAFGWLAYIPETRYVLRRILGARALVHPLTERHIYPWRRLATLLGTDHKAVQRWHGQAVMLLVQAAFNLI